MHTAGSHKARATLGGVAIGTAVLLLSWTFILGSLWRHTDFTTAGGIVALAYPFGDMVIIFLIVLSVCSMTATGRRPLLWVLVGLFAMAVSNSTYAYLVEVGRYATGNLVDIGWVVAYLAIAVGASSDASQTVLAPSHQAAEVSLVSLVTPYVPVLLALSVITFELELHHHVDRFSWLTGLGLALLVIVRQALLLADGRRELISASAGRDGPASGSTGAQPPLEKPANAAPWLQFLRRTREPHPRYFRNPQAPTGNTEPAARHDGARPHGRHLHHRGIRPLPVRVLSFALTRRNFSHCHR
jgi:hypothetical protein